MNYSSSRIHKIIQSLSILSLFFFFSQAATGQDYFLPLNSLSQLRMERANLSNQKGLHYGFKPALMRGANVEKIEGIGRDTAKYYYWITAKLYGEHLIQLKKPNIQLYVDPLFDFSYGQEFTAPVGGSHSLYTNTRGFTLSAKIGEKVYFHTDFRENQARFPDYLSDFVDSLGVVPGSGRVKDFKTDAFDFNMASGYVGIEAAKWLSINFGHSKQFLGDGHRSLLLSDNAFNYPYASYILRFGKENQFHYRYSIALMQNLDRLPAGDTPESIFKRKYMSYSYLSYKPIAMLELGFYESVIWKDYDNTTGTEPFNFNALNPVPLVNTAIYGFSNSKANPRVGMNVAWQPVEKLRVYGQAMLDDPDKEKYGYQLGFKVFKILQRIDFNAEYNKITSGSYAAEDPLLGYTNSNQPLAHPLGAGFQEIYSSLVYYYNRWLASFQYVYSTYDKQGRDPLVSDATDLHYDLENVAYQNLKLAYVFNPRTNMQVYISVTNRMEKSTFESRNDQFWYFGLRTYLQNICKDF